MPVALRIVNDVSYVTRINDASHFSWRIVNDVSYVATRINDASHFSWQAQYLVTLVDDTCCSAHCK